MSSTAIHIARFRNCIAIVMLMVFISSFTIDTFGEQLWGKSKTELVDFETESDQEKESKNSKKESGDHFIVIDQVLTSFLTNVELTFAETTFTELKEMQEVLSPPPEHCA